MIELKEDRRDLPRRPPLWPELATESTFSPRALFTAVNRQGVVFLWPCRMPGPTASSTSGAGRRWRPPTWPGAGWVRVAANMSLGAYDVFQATGDLPDPEWPDTPFKELLRVAFKDRFIDTLDHPVLRELRGEV